MAKTVAEIDGDSSGLVSALDKGKAGMKDLGTQGKKLSDQLRDVADQADIAAGNLISKIGGPGAITAIGGIGIAFAGVGKVIDAVGQSMESFYSAQGDKGAVAMASITQAMDDLKGSLFTAVVGTEDLDEATDTVIATLRTAKEAFELLLLPISSVAAAVRQATSDEVALGKQVYETIKANKLYAEQTAFVVLANQQTKISVDALIESLKIELSTVQQLKAANEMNRLEEIDASIASIDAGVAARASIAGEIAMAKERDKILGPMRANFIKVQREEEARRAGEVVPVSEASIIARANKAFEKDSRLMDRVRTAENAAYAAAVAENSDIGQDELRQRTTLLDQRAQLEQKYAEERLAVENAGKPAKTGGGGVAKAPEKTAAEIEAEELKAINDLRLANTEGEKQLELDRLKWDAEQRDIEFEKKKEALQRVTDFGQQMLDEAAAERKAKGILTAEEEDALYQERLSKALTYVQDLAGQEMGIYMQNAAKQLALGKLSAKAASDMARSALGNMIIGQGDKAMVEAGIMAAAMNPLAVPMAAAGLAAYAVGNAMMPTVKPSAGSTPATEKPTDSGQAASNNYSFNMRVDSVFADGESVARQFAMMQESARARGLLMQGA
jgi:hypothetical protein